MEMRLAQVLSKVVDSLQGSDIVWALTGSASFALQGVTVDVHDIDIQTDAAGAYAIERLFEGKVTRPVTFVESQKIKSHLGAFEVEGVTVEVMGALQKRVRHGKEKGAGSTSPAVEVLTDWEPPVDVANLRVFVSWRGRRVPVLPLEYEYGAYLQLGRFERARVLREFLRHRTAEGDVAVVCSTSSLSRLAGGTWSDPSATVRGVCRLGWPFVELRTWDEWNCPIVEVASRICDCADVFSVHAPPETEELMSLPDSGPVRSLLGRCADAALAVGAKTVVVHAWDLRKKTFDRGMLFRNLRDESRRLREMGIDLSVENIPGHASFILDIADACPEVKFTVDTQWTVLEESWDIAYSLAPRVNDIHFQTYIDIVDGNPSLGRVSGGRFDPEEVLGEFMRRGFRGFVTLEPKNVYENDDARLRSALAALKRLSAAGPGSAAL